MYFGTTIPITSSGGVTFLPYIKGIYEYERLDGFSQIIVHSLNKIYYGSGTSLTQVYDYGIATSSKPTSFLTFNNALFLFDGNIRSLKYTGSTFYLFGLPVGVYEGLGFPWGITAAAGTSGTGYSGTISVKLTWIDLLGYRGVPNPTAATITLNGVSYSQFSVYFDQTFYTGNKDIWGITALSINVQPPGGANYYEIGSFSLTISGNTAIVNSSGSSATSNSANQSIFNYPLLQYPNIFGPGLDPNFSYVSYSEVYNNQLYLAGFTSTTYLEGPLFGTTFTANYQSRLYWTEVGEPEFIDPTFFAEVRTNDGDRITGLRSHLNSLLIFKTRSFHRLIATSATDVSIQQISDQYGCLSHHCAITYNQQCLFLDRKGIVRWDGANVSIASNKVEPIFQRMNVQAAIDNAVGFHYKSRNELWFCIPVDGATLNNLAVIYDYFSDAWTTYSGFIPSSVVIAQGRLPTFEGFYGSYTGGIFNFGSTLPSDNGSGITCVISSLFYRDLGQSVEKQWRRLFMNVDPFTPGATVTVNMIPEYGTSIYATRYMPVGGFQNRIDFGIPAKTLQFQMIYSNATLPIRINGITVESRYQRSV